MTELAAETKKGFLKVLFGGKRIEKFEWGVQRAGGRICGKHSKICPDLCSAKKGERFTEKVSSSERSVSECAFLEDVLRWWPSWAALSVFLQSSACSPLCASLHSEEQSHYTGSHLTGSLELKLAGSSSAGISQGNPLLVAFFHCISGSSYWCLRQGWRRNCSTRWLNDESSTNFQTK